MLETKENTDSNALRTRTRENTEGKIIEKAFRASSTNENKFAELFPAVLSSI